MRAILLLILATALLSAQTASQPLSREEEQRLLQEDVSQAGNSPVDFIRAGERHLKRFPNSLIRDDLDRAILRAAIDVSDFRRTIRYGERVLAKDDDLMLLDRVARAFLASDDAESARRGLKYAERLEKKAREMQPQAGSPARQAEAQQEADRTVARSLVLQARAWGNSGNLEKAIEQARRSYQVYATGEAASESARWELRAGQLPQALEHYADAFTIPDSRVTDDDRAFYRRVLGETYTKLRGSNAGLGDVVLRAYDRTAALVQARETALKAVNPNKGVTDAFEFRLSGLRGPSLRLADFRGKILVIDFWATWCVPCRAQHPLLEQLKAKYRPDAGVAFVSINSDEDRAAVKPFLAQQKWSGDIYFEDGLALFYRVSSIPTTMVFNARGEMVSRLPGFAPESYVKSITTAIEQARSE
jgi:thiol-disulfide isomerase/thioredoxin